jgi:adenylate cyclase
MSIEIERKFLVRGNGWQQLATSHTFIRQAYLASNGKSSIRVRIKSDGTATLTVKSRPVSLRRLELEYDIPVLEAEAMVQLRRGTIIEKVRYLVPCGDLVWEVDVFSGENLGLVIAEIELQPRASVHRIAALGRQRDHRAAAVLQQFPGPPSLLRVVGGAGRKRVGGQRGVSFTT